MASLIPEEYRSIRGFQDILPEEIRFWEELETTMYGLIYSYGYSQIRLPLLEKTGLFKRAIGSVTDIVEKEMFTFSDEKQRSLSLRPEGTASCVRACLEHSLFRKLPRKLWYQGPMFRYEAPQKGRNRQFYQLGVECFGVSSSEAELEQIIIFSKLWQKLNLSKQICLEINNIGMPATRNCYIKDLISYFNKYKEYLDRDCLRRLEVNPLRILDSKNPDLQDILQQAPKLINYLEPAALNSYESLKLGLDRLNIKYIENPRIVRGLDYYTGNVWEWTSSLLGAQSAVGAGGRYDSLVEQLGGDPVAAVGLAVGLDRIVLLLQQLSNFKTKQLDAYLICSNNLAYIDKFLVVEQLRDLYPNLHLEVDLLGGTFKSQFKRADRSGAKLALILGEEEFSQDKIRVKYLRAGCDDPNLEALQPTVSIKELFKLL